MYQAIGDKLNVIVSYSHFRGHRDIINMGILIRALPYAPYITFPSSPLSIRALSIKSPLDKVKSAL